MAYSDENQSRLRPIVGGTVLGTLLVGFWLFYDLYTDSGTWNWDTMVGPFVVVAVAGVGIGLAWKRPMLVGFSIGALLALLSAFAFVLAILNSLGEA